MIIDAIQKSRASFVEKGWSKMYWAFDIHGTILKPTNSSRISDEFYPHAKEVLQKLQGIQGTVLILYTCSYPHEIAQYIDYFRTHGIVFDYINSNPEVVDGAYGYYQDKPYFNVLLDDKAGFDADTEWEKILQIV